MLRYLLISLCLPLGAQAPFTIASVDRVGPPPYESEGRIYRLDAGQNRGVRVGERLAVRRPGQPRPLGHLQVVTVGAEVAGTVFLPSAGDWPMKGDLVTREELAGLPTWAEVDIEPLPVPLAPKPGMAAPPREGLIYFLPQRADLSPAGRKKVESWVQHWGVEGRWVVQIPLSKALKPTLQKQRADALLTALRELGVHEVEWHKEARAHDGPYDPSWVLHWD
jgi:hypothetical protein